jgi:hypothetical protein
MLVLTFTDREDVAWSAWRIPYGRNLGLLDKSHYFFFQVAPQCMHEAEQTLFQTHYFSENLVAPGINPDLWICSQEL